MKTAFLLFVVLIAHFDQFTSLRLLPFTPKAADLRDHFGTEPVKNIYGPGRSNTLNQVNIRREGAIPGEIVSPIDNFHKEIDLNSVASGNLDNTAKDASKIVVPELAAPKAHIEADVTHETIVKTPVQLGNKVENKNITVMDRRTGLVQNHNIKVVKPIMAVLKTPREVTTKIKSTVNIIDGKVYPLMEEMPRNFHGIDSTNNQPTSPSTGKTN